MIQNINHKGLKRYFVSGDQSGLPANYVKKIRLVLMTLHSTTSIEGINLSGLHSLTGKKKGFWSVTVSANWRITFRMEEGDVYDIDYEDYH